MSTGSRIKALRKQKNISQEKLCCNSTKFKILNRSILSRIENDKMQPSIAQIKYIAEILDVPVNYFLSEFNYEDSPIVSSPDLCNDLQNLFKGGKYFKDLTVMWEDLFIMTQDNQYKEKISLNSKVPLRKIYLYNVLYSLHQRS